jgi:hypothetical protein
MRRNVSRTGQSTKLIRLTLLSTRTKSTLYKLGSRTEKCAHRKFEVPEVERYVMDATQFAAVRISVLSPY